MAKEELTGIGTIYQRSRKDPKSKDKKKRITSPTWWVQYYHRGQKIRKSTGTTSQKKAVQFLKAEIEKSLGGTLVIGSASRMTFQDLAKMLERDYQRNGRRSLDRAQDAITHLAGYFGSNKAIEIAENPIDPYVDYRFEIDHAKPGTVAYEISILRRMFHLAENIIGRIPKFPAIRGQNVRKGFFEEHEFAAFLEKLEVDLKAPIQMAYLTGWRIRSEIFPLQWSQVDFPAGEVRLEPGTTKTDEGRTFPLTVFPELAELLKRQRITTDQVQRETGRIIPWVFHRNGERIRCMRGAWDTALEESKICRKDENGRWINKKIPHDFRRTAVRNLERAGVPRSVAMKLVGHKTEEIYRRYAIVGKNDLVDGVKRLSEYRDAMKQAANVVSINQK